MKKFIVISLFLFSFLIGAYNLSCVDTVSFSDESLRLVRTGQGQLSLEAERSENFKRIVKLVQKARDDATITEDDVKQEIIQEAKALSNLYHIEITPDDLVLGVDFQTILAKVQSAIKETRERSPTKAVGIGGGGGFINVTLQALRNMYNRVVASMPGTDNGGSTGKIQEVVKPFLGYIFGVGDTANVLVETIPQYLYTIKDEILSNRPKEYLDSAYETVYDLLERNIKELAKAESKAPVSDFYFFIANQLKVAQIIDESFIRLVDSEGNKIMPKFSDIVGQSIRNLNFLAAYYATETFLEGGRLNLDNAEATMYLLEKMFGVEVNSAGYTKVHPVLSVYDAAISYAVYDHVLTDAERAYIESKLGDYLQKYPYAIQEIKGPDGKLVTVVFGQQFIDQIMHSGEIIHFGIVSEVPDHNLEDIATLDSLDVRDSLRAPPGTIEEINNAEDIITIGAGSMYSSLLCQLTIPGVAEALAKRKEKGDIPIVLVVNMSLVDETNKLTLHKYINMIIEETGYDFITHVVVNAPGVIKSIEKKVGTPHEYMASLIRAEGVEKVGDLYKLPTSPIAGRDLYVKETLTGLYFVDKDGNSIFITPEGELSTDPGDEGILTEGDVTVGGIYLNAYTYYMLSHPELQTDLGLSNNDWKNEMGMAGFLYMSEELYESRRERGRYRGALYATDSDIEYLESLDIEVVEGKFIGWEKKTLKKVGEEVTYETFVGLKWEEIRAALERILRLWS